MNRRVPLFHAELVDGFEDAHAGVVHQNVEAAEPFRRRANQLAAVFVVADVRRRAIHIGGTALRSFSRAACNDFGSRPQMKTFAPSASNACATQKPIPRDPPVTTATLSFNSLVIISPLPKR